MAFILTPMNPTFLTWEAWSTAAALDLTETGYNAVGAVSERQWQTWANELLYIPDLVELGCPSPLPYGDNWRGWAAALHTLTA